MDEKTFEELTPEESDKLIEAMLSEDFGELTLNEFFTALAAIDEEEQREVIELTGSVKDSQFVFKEPAPLRVKGNEILLGDKRIIIKLLPEAI
ncbi:hypothetical protein FJZ31_00770 [Candidatus Poribacteria bacterium]|nr:hypothetical protein [Candidatus Poribacteria bacterium]